MTRKVILKYNNDSLLNLLCSKKNLASAQPDIFQGRFRGIRALDKHFVKNTRNVLEFFS